jgi:hypothetical protein
MPTWLARALLVCGLLLPCAASSQVGITGAGSPGIGPITVTDVGNSNASATSLAMHPSSAVPAGSLILILDIDVSLSAGTHGAVTDTQGNSYAVASSFAVSGTGVEVIWYAFNSKALSTSDTITYTDANAVELQMDVADARNVLASANPLDSATAGNADSPSTNTPSVTSGSPSLKGDLFVALVWGNSSVAATTQSPGWSSSLSYSPGTTPTNFVAGTIVNTGSGTETYAPTGGTPGGWQAQIIAFKPAL